MSDHNIPTAAVGEATINALHSTFRRMPARGPIQADGSQVLTFTPDLTPAEMATLDLIVAAAAASAPVTPADISAIRPQMQTLRALRQMGRNAFMALSQAERDRLIYDNLVAVTQIFIAMTRDA